MELNAIIDYLNRGQLVVARSDTVYGIFAMANNQAAVHYLHEVRQRQPNQGFIVLADSVATVAKMTSLSPEVRRRLDKFWPKKPEATLAATSVILEASSKTPLYLVDKRYQPSICFRVPNDKNWRQVLKKTGPLVAPSANPPGLPPAKNIAEARAYFGDAVAFYLDGGIVGADAKPSRVIKLKASGMIETVRDNNQITAEDFVVKRRRKQFRFAKFNQFDNCFTLDEWRRQSHKILAGQSTIIAELAAGSARLSVELARQNVDQFLVAIDIKSDRLYQGARDALAIGLKNIVFLRADICQLADIFPTQSLAAIWLTFPDPYIKNDVPESASWSEKLSKTGQKKRLSAERFLKLYAQVLKPDGYLNFKTDSRPLFEWSLEKFTAAGWQIQFQTRNLHVSNAPASAKIKTSYELRFVSQKLPILYASFRPSNG
jgi:tRNA (guanine-N7-)-methyltransferase